MKKVILAGLLLGAAHGLTAAPVEAHSVRHRPHGHGHHHHAPRAPKHNHCHRHVNKGFSHCHKHTHGGPGYGHHGRPWIHPIPVYYPNSLQIHLDF